MRTQNEKARLERTNQNPFRVGKSKSSWREHETSKHINKYAEEVPQKIQFEEKDGAFNILVPDSYLGDKNYTKEQL